MATERDYKDILAIRTTVFDGRDYLKDLLMYIINRNEGYVAVLEHEIIGFISASIIDNGMTLLTRAARVKEEFEGKGVIRILDQHNFKTYENSAIYHAGSFFDTNSKLMKKIKDGIWNVTICKKSVEYVIGTTELGKKEPAMKTSDTVKNLTPYDVENIFFSKNLCHQLFPANLLSSNGIPLRIMKENIVHIFEQNGVVLGHNVTEGEDHSRALLSIGHTFTCQLGQIYTLDMCGPDVDMLSDHMAVHIFQNKIVDQTKEEKLICQLYIEPELESWVDKTMMKLGFQKQDGNVASLLYFIEHNI